jgi:type II secretory pathway component GspD/PulD (secretin)
MKLRTLLALFAILVPLAAQETAPAMTTRIFEVKYQDVNRLANLLGPFGAKLQPSSELKAIAVSGPPDVVTAVGEALMRFDIPLKNVELTAYLLVGTSQASQQDNAPKELEGVTKQLKSLFAFQGFHVLDTLVLRGREGQQLAASGTAASQPPASPTTYDIGVGSVSVASSGKENVVKVDRLRFSARYVPAPGSQYNIGFNTDLDVREGQKVVVGKTGMGPDALILVVTAKVVD